MIGMAWIGAVLAQLFVSMLFILLGSAIMDANDGAAMNLTFWCLMLGWAPPYMFYELGRHV